MSDIEEISQKDVSSEAKIFDIRLQKRKEAVLDSEKYEEFVISELKRQEELKSEKGKAQKTTRAKKRELKPKKVVKKRPPRKAKRTSYYDSSGSEKSNDIDDYVPRAKSPSPTINLSSDEGNDTNTENNVGENSEFALTKSTQKRLQKRHEKRQKEIEAFNLEDYDLDDDDNCVIICDDTDDLDSHEINLKIWCKGEILCKKLKSSRTFSEVFQYISELKNVPASDILIYFNDVAIDVEDTPNKLGISASDFLSCVIVSPDASTVKNQNCIEIKIQSKDSKTKTVMSVYKLDPLQKFMQKYADDKGLTLQKLLFEFDGEKILANQTPVELEIDDGCIIDVKILK